MATLRASWPAPVAVAATSRSPRPIRVAIGWQGTSPAPARTIQARTRDLFRFHCQKGADDHPAPEPEPEAEPGLDDDVMARPWKSFVDLIPANSDDPFMQEIRRFHVAFCAAAAIREAPDMFSNEKEEISGYMMKISSSRVGIQAQTALDLASIVMDLTDMASLDVGTAEFSQHTLNQMVRMYTPIFRNAAENAYRERIKRSTVLSFLDALRGLVTICHVLVQDTVALIQDGHPLKNSVTEEMTRRSCEYGRKANSLKEEFSTAALKHTVVMDILFNGIKQAQLYVCQLIQDRREALGVLILVKARKLQEAQNAKRLRDTGSSS